MLSKTNEFNLANGRANMLNNVLEFERSQKTKLQEEVNQLKAVIEKER